MLLLYLWEILCVSRYEGDADLVQSPVYVKSVHLGGVPGDKLSAHPKPTKLGIIKVFFLFIYYNTLSGYAA